MMQSIALSESFQHEDDFVIVEHHNHSPPACNSDVAEDETFDEHDYCLVHSVSFDHEGLQAYHHQEDIPSYLEPFDMNETVGQAEHDDEIPTREISSLLEEIDAISAVEVISEIPALVEGIDKHHMIADQDADHSEHDATKENFLTRPLKSVTDESYSGDTEGSSELVPKLKTSSPNSHDDDKAGCDNGRTVSSASETVATGNSASSVLSATTTSVNNKKSRLSNKKRRKQRKLAKKAAAAAIASAALSQMASIAVRSPTKGNRKNRSTRIKTTPVSSNKKQVACVTQSLASYREEVSRTVKKKMR